MEDKKPTVTLVPPPRHYDTIFLYILNNFSMVESRWPKEIGDKHKGSTILFKFNQSVQPKIERVRRMAMSQAGPTRSEFPSFPLTEAQEVQLVERVTVKVMTKLSELSDDVIRAGIFMALPEINRYN